MFFANYPPAPCCRIQIDASSKERISQHVINVRPFVLAGVGLSLSEPTSGKSDTTSSKEPVFCPWRRPGLGPSPAHALALAVPRQPLQDSRHCQGFSLEWRFHAYGGADDRSVPPVLTWSAKLQWQSLQVPTHFLTLTRLYSPTRAVLPLQYGVPLPIVTYASGLS